MLNNRAKQRITSGQVALGVSCGLGAPYIAEVLAGAGFDWVLIDNQHGMWDRQSSALAMMGVRAGGSTAVVRAPENDYYAIGRLLDEGALGVIVPMVENRAEAEQVVRASRYPPVGGRSDGVSGAGVYGPSYREQANDEILVAIQLESRTAIDNADEIMSVEGVDACWLGPADLANSLGHARNTPEHDAAVNEMIAACKRHGKAAGIAGGSVEQVEKWVAAGCTFISAGGDKIYLGGGAAAEFNALAGLRE